MLLHSLRKFGILLLMLPCLSLATEVPEYVAMRAARPDGRSVTVSDFTLVRDAYKLTFRSGAFHFLAPLGDRTFGAVFVGEGTYSLDPATEAERNHLALVTGDRQLEALSDSFDTMILLFSDATAHEITAHSSVTQGSADPRARTLYEEHLKRQKNKFQVNLHLRVLIDLLNSTVEKQGVFLAAVDGKRLAPALIAVDPLGIGNLAAGFGGLGGEETAFLSFDENNGGFWYLNAAVGTALEGRGKPQRLMADAEHYSIDTTIKSNTEIEGVAVIRFRPSKSGMRVLPIHILPKLRLIEATSGEQTLGIVQEDVQLGRFARLFRDEVGDADAALVFPEPIQGTEPLEVRIRYEGRDVLQSVGSDSFSVGARESWYPNFGTFTDTATYQLTFRYPKKNTLISVGDLVSEKQEGNQKVAVWKSDEPMRVAGFNYGKFDKISRKDETTGLLIDVYTNPDFRKMAGDTMADAMNASRVGTAMFGKAPYSPMSVTQQSEWTFGQSWPSLIYLPSLALITSTERVAMFEGPEVFQINEFAKTVGWHEVAHQWWGHQVGWESYRDQWLSEGFAEFTAAMVLQFTESPQRYVDFWKRRGEEIVRKRGQVANSDAGPITQGFRLSTRHSPEAGSAMVYSKGGYVLHMLRMMMRDPSQKNPDQKFFDLMQDFVASYAGKNPSTGDFQRVVEKHMTPQMDSTRNRKMDWFFDQWVRGKEIPRLRSTLTIKPAGEGKYRLSGEVRQEGVGPSFRTLVPIYLDFGRDELARIGTVHLVGNANANVETELPVPRQPKRVLINAMHDVLTRN